MITRLEKLHKTNRNVFSINDLKIIWQINERRDIIESTKDYIRRGRLFSPHRGIYTLERKYDKYEFAQKLIIPSYISYYTALAMHGIIFQQYTQIHCIGNYTKLINVDGQEYQYHKVSEHILLNRLGIERVSNYSIATPERALCDSLYLNKDLAFDNLQNVNIKKLKKIVRIYDNKRLSRDIAALIKNINNI